MRVIPRLLLTLILLIIFGALGFSILTHRV